MLCVRPSNANSLLHYPNTHEDLMYSLATKGRTPIRQRLTVPVSYWEILHNPCPVLHKVGLNPGPSGTSELLLFGWLHSLPPYALPYLSPRGGVVPWQALAPILELPVPGRVSSTRKLEIHPLWQ